MDNQNYNAGEKRPGSGLAVASMILGIIALCLGVCWYYISIPAAVLSIIFAAVTLGGHRGGKGMAIAGLVCSIVSLVPAIIIISTGAALLSF